MSMRYPSNKTSTEINPHNKRGLATEAEIEAGLDYLAYLIDQYGDQFWPVFDRLDRELEARRSRAARIQARLNRSRSHMAHASLLSVS